MPSIDSIAEALFGSKRAETQEVLTDATTRTYVGTAVSDSEDGAVRVDLGGDVTLPDDIEGVAEYDASGIEVATSPNVRAGDEVVVTVFGGSTLKTPMVTGVMGSGDRQEAGIETAQSRADDAWDYADDAATAAETAWDWADDAHDAAQTAWNHADDAATAAATAQNSATAANFAASSALTQLSIVEDVAGTLNWISEHGTYVATTDTTVHDGTVYFEYTGGDYVPIASPDPTANPQQEGWYVLDVTDSQSDYIMAHLAVTSQGLWVLPSGITYELSQDTEVVTGRAYFTRSGSGTAGDPYAYTPVNPQGSEDPHALGWYVHTERYSAGYKVLLASNGMTVYDGTGTAVAAYGGTGIRFADDRTFYVGDEDAFVFFDGNGHIEIGGAVNLGSTHTLSELLAAYDTAALSVKILSSNGTGFVDETGSTVLTCKVYQYGDQELDPQGTSFGYSWSTGATSKSITVSAPATTATYTCEVTISGVSVTLSESITLTNVNSGQQGPQGPAGADGKTLYATCSTSAGTQTKAAYLSPEASSLTLYTGLTVQVKFSNANSYASGAVKLNLYKTSSAGLGAIDVHYNDAATSSTNTLGWAAGAVLTFTYDGTYWRVADNGSMGAVYREQVIWYRSDSVTAPTAPTTWLTTNTDQYNGWSIKVTPAAANRNSGTTYYQYLYTCIQRQAMAQMGTTACTCTAVVLDETTTVVHGSMVVERSLQAKHIKANSLTVGNIDTSDSATAEAIVNNATYGYCDYVNNATYEVTDCDSFVLRDGAEIVVYFDIDHGGYYFNLNVNDTGAKAVMVAGQACSNTNNLVFRQGTMLTFRYSANVWWLVSPAGSIEGTCSTSASTRTKYVDVPDGTYYLKGTTLNMYCSNENTYGSASLKINVGDIQYGTYSVKANGSVTSSSNTLSWSAATVLTFTYDGECWVFAGKSSDGMTADNYIAVDSSGIRIADASPGSSATYQHQSATGTGFYVSGVLRNLISALGMQLFVPDQNAQDGRAESAFFGSNLVELAKNSASAVIKMVSGLMQLSYTAASGSETGAGKLFSEDGLMLDSNPKSINGEQVGRAFLWFHGTRVNNDGINTRITISANSDPDGTADDGYRHSASINIVGGDAGMSSGSPTSAYVSVSDPYQISNYLQIGSPGYESSSDTKTVPNNTTTTICSISLPAGVWMVNSFMRYAQNGSGVRKAGLVTSSTGSCDHAWAPANGDVTTADMIHRREITASTTYYLRAYQNSGTSLSVSGSIVAYRLT